MPSARHEVLIEMFRHRPPLVAELLTGPFGIKVPEWQRVQVLEGDLSELLPTEYRADLVSVLYGANGEPVQAVVVEVQLRKDRRKRRSWARTSPCSTPDWAVRSSCWWSLRAGPRHGGRRPRSRSGPGPW